MKICFPIKNNQGLKSEVNIHFGSTKEFLIYDTETNNYEVVQNCDADHSHGMCQPLKTLNGKNVDVVVVGGLGLGALNKLTIMGIKVFKAEQTTVENNINKINNNELQLMDTNEVCAGHGHGACGH